MTIKAYFLNSFPKNLSYDYYPIKQSSDSYLSCERFRDRAQSIVQIAFY